MNVSPECENQSNPALAIAGSVILIVGVAVGVSGLIAALVMCRKMRSSHCITLTHSTLYANIMCRASKGEGEVSTEDNLAYGLSEPRGKRAESKGDYEIPDTMQPFPPGAPAQESVYEGVY